MSPTSVVLIPNRPADQPDSVHLAMVPSAGAAADEADADWQEVLAIRDVGLGPGLCIQFGEEPTHAEPTIVLQYHSRSSVVNGCPSDHFMPLRR